jgi:hypothetical protein
MQQTRAVHQFVCTAQGYSVFGGVVDKMPQEQYRVLTDVRMPWVRDVPCEAERSQVRCGPIPQVMAAFRTRSLVCCAGQGYAHGGVSPMRCAANVSTCIIGLALEN